MGHTKPTIMMIDNVKIVQDNSQNLAIYRLEETYNPFKGETNETYQFKGFYSTVSACLKAIIYKELLIDKSAIQDVERCIREVQRSNARILKELGELVNQSSARILKELEQLK